MIKLFKSPAGILTILLLVVFTAWRLEIIVNPPIGEAPHDQLFYWAATYQLVALWGAFWGFVVSRSWGGFHSIMGRAVMSFAGGLLFQSFGQTVYTVLIFRGLEIPYPSLGDVGFFGSIPLYIYGTLLLARASGVTISLRSYVNKIQALLVPLLMLGLSYFYFLRGYEFDWSQPLTVFLDFGYPLGQAAYVSIAILTFILSRKFLGGMMRKPTLLLLVALIMQYFSDYTFLYQAKAGTYVGAGMVDYMYLLSYFLMGLSLIQIGATYKEIRLTSNNF